MTNPTKAIQQLQGMRYDLCNEYEKHLHDGGEYDRETEDNIEALELAIHEMRMKYEPPYALVKAAQTAAQVAELMNAGVPTVAELVKQFEEYQKSVKEKVDNGKPNL